MSQSVSFSPYHLHGYFHSAGKTATSRLISADVSSVMAPPTDLQPIADFVVVPPISSRIQTRGREIPGRTRPAAVPLLWVYRRLSPVRGRQNKHIRV